MARNTFKVDEELDAPFDATHLKRALVYLGKYSWNLVIVFVVTVAHMLLGLVLPLLQRKIIDVYIPEESIKKILLLIPAFVAIIVLQAVFSYIRNRLNAVTGQGVVANIRKDLFEHLQKLPFDYYDSRPAGKIFVRVVNYVNSVADFLASGLVNIVLELLSIILTFIFMMSVSVQLTLVVVSGIPFFAIFVFILKPKQRKAWTIQNNKQSNMTAYLAENINGVRITQAFSRETYNAKIMDGLLEDNRKSFMKVAYLMHSMWPTVFLISRIMVCALYVFAVYALRDQLDSDALKLGSLVAMASFAWRFWWPIQNLGNIYNNLISTVSYLERIFQVLDEKVSVFDKENAYELPTINGNVTFLNVQFSYEPGIPILKGVTFEAMAGESIALVGPTGAGKTTIINLLSRFYNIGGGTIYIDGHDIYEASINSIRRQMGVMLQDAFIFAGTIIENIRYGKLDATDEECIACAKAVMADEFIKKLPDGYYSEVKERGDGLSAGQKQLLSFARTMLADPRILILDEATSSIDTQTEKLVQDGIAALLKKRTSFIVAHRLSTIKNCTKILYIAAGEIAEQGSHDELMEKKGLYYQLYMSQVE